MALDRSSVEIGPRPKGRGPFHGNVPIGGDSQGIRMISKLPQTWNCQLLACPAKSTLCRKNTSLGIMALLKAS